MNILLLGSGGREHAMAWKIAQSPKVTNLYIAPGNAGTSTIGQNVSVNPVDFDAVANLIVDKLIDMVVVGPEAPLVEGIVEFVANHPVIHDIPVIGPGKVGATLEGSKDFAKAFMMRHGIPTAKYFTVDNTNLNQGIAFMRTLDAPYVLKADGLAAGKGVLIVPLFDDAVSELKTILDGRFGAAGNKVVIEEFLSGIELSVFVMSDGENYKLLPEAKDYKRIGEGDSGPNTGGMGAVSPVSFATPEFMKKVEDQIIIPTIDGLKSEAINYRGFIFLGLINCYGNPKVIEYNVRMGDPETEAVMLRIQSDFVDLLEGVATQTLKHKEIVVDKRAAVTVMVVSGGYPDEYEKGKIISGLDEIMDSVVFHAGTTVKDGEVVSSGGRVLSVSSYGKSKDEALSRSYESIKKISFEGMYYRTDIGFDLK